MSTRRAFTLIEMIMALAACAVILTAVYGVFTRAIHLRNDATERVSASRSRAHAAAVLRNDLRNARISGGKLAAALTGSRDTRTSSFPGYLKFTATTARETGDLIGSDLQQIEYYVTTDPEASGERKTGMLVRAVDRNLLAPTRETPPETPLLRGVETMEVSFYDGQSWTDTWDHQPEDTTLPEAVRVSIRQVASGKLAALPPIEVLVPWTTQLVAAP